MARGEPSTRSRRRRRTVAVEDEAPVSKRERGLAGQLREDEVELKVGSVQAERRWRDGATVSLSSLAFGRQWQRCSEAWEWRKKEGMCPLASWGSRSA
jgi:hypothetical protein